MKIELSLIEFKHMKKAVEKYRHCLHFEALQAAAANQIELAKVRGTEVKCLDKLITKFNSIIIHE